MEAAARLKGKLRGHAAARCTSGPRCSTGGSIWARTSLSTARRTRPAPCASATDPATSVLDLDCKAHELDNLYVADASFFPSIGAVNPTLTIIANALRVADRIKARPDGHDGRAARRRASCGSAAWWLTSTGPKRSTATGSASGRPGTWSRTCAGGAAGPAKRAWPTAGCGLADRRSRWSASIPRPAYPPDSRSDDLWFQHLAIVVRRHGCGLRRA